MIHFEEFTLKNGLKVIIHPDPKVSTVCVNTLYKVGSRNENPEKTGFAHLFEHLMFGGSKNVPSFDEQLQLAGGENNAFTSTDITNYYITVPSINLETALWLESDRMLSLSFDPKVLEVQRKVVIEEFRQRYLNQPYGDLWLKLRPEAYRIHPYRWATIGKDISHIENATMEDVRSFFGKYYAPNNAILVLAGDITVEKGQKLVEKWFGDIPKGQTVDDEIPKEPLQNEVRELEVEADVPQNSITKVFHMPGRGEDDYYPVDLISDLAGRGKSSLLYEKLVKEKNLFSSINSYVTGSMDPGLLVVSGKLNNGSFDEAEKEINLLLEDIMSHSIKGQDLEKVKNIALSSVVFGEIDVLNRAMSLAYSSYLGNTNKVNEEEERIENVTADDITRLAPEILRPTNCTTLYYKKSNQ
jgi:zinc protease